MNGDLPFYKYVKDEVTLISYGKIIRGDENSSEDQIGTGVDENIAKLLVNRFNAVTDVKYLIKILEKGCITKEVLIQIKKIKSQIE